MSKFIINDNEKKILVNLDIDDDGDLELRINKKLILFINTDATLYMVGE